MAVEPTIPPQPAEPVKAGATRKATAAKPAAPKARAAAGTVKADAKKVTRQATATVRQEAGNLKRKASDKAHALADQGKAAATERLDGFSRLIDDAATQVDDRLGAQYGDYARSAADAVAGLASTLRGKEVDDLVADARAFVKKSPVIAVGAAAAVGFVLARLVKAGLDAADRAADGREDRA
ncbi:hypothetical protein D1610_12240 [Sphingomonas gilva]|uniref:DUF883 family protein n=1 Tax=Sphingomonas gilva TaxID=2305907 RepID=A0A396RUC6_9SPHN|nr:hypothetical protein [Sphingomonas gilva]RHW17301.1 hypothetical protein D1610_12240 [Sphingomonas gilva]